MIRAILVWVIYGFWIAILADDSLPTGWAAAAVAFFVAVGLYAPIVLQIIASREKRRADLEAKAAMTAAAAKVAEEVAGVKESLDLTTAVTDKKLDEIVTAGVENMKVTKETHGAVNGALGAALKSVLTAAEVTHAMAERLAKLFPDSAVDAAAVAITAAKVKEAKDQYDQHEQQQQQAKAVAAASPPAKPPESKAASVAVIGMVKDVGKAVDKVERLADDVKEKLK